jgi:hypothetical protein
VKLSRGDEKWAEASSSVAGFILMIDLVLFGTGIACLALGWSAPAGYALIAIAVLIFLFAS